MNNDFIVREFTPADGPAFKALNIEWLEAYFEVEAYDEQVLSNPQSEILAKGGRIFMAELDGEIIGTFAFIFRGEGYYEFSKMAITPLFRGQGYGNAMMRAAIAYAEKHRWSKIVLYSSTKLNNSIHLYRKYGFIEVPLEANAFYARGDIKMELTL